MRNKRELLLRDISLVLQINFQFLAIGSSATVGSSGNKHGSVFISALASIQLISFATFDNSVPSL